MKEIRTIKMVEVTDVKFVADDGKEFVGENAEYKCREYERTCDRKKVEDRFKRLDVVKLEIPLIKWFTPDCELYKIILNSRDDYFAMMDYYNAIRDRCGYYEVNIDEPATYPYTMIVSEWESYVCEYTRDIKADIQTMQKTLEQLG